MTKLCRELIADLSRGHVYDMLDVWRKYESMDRGIGTTIPKKYLSRKTSFYKVVQQLIGSKVQQLMYPGEQSDILISRTLQSQLSLKCSHQIPNQVKTKIVALRGLINRTSSKTW